jgi:hypothetical protein
MGGKIQSVMELAFACASSVGFVMPYWLYCYLVRLSTGWRLFQHGSLNYQLRVRTCLFGLGYLCIFVTLKIGRVGCVV